MVREDELDIYKVKVEVIVLYIRTKVPVYGEDQLNYTF